MCAQKGLWCAVKCEHSLVSLQERGGSSARPLYVEFNKTKQNFVLKLYYRRVTVTVASPSSSRHRHRFNHG